MAVLNVYKKDDIKIDYFDRVDMFSLMKDKKKIWLTTTSLQIVFTLLTSEVEYECVLVDQNGDHVEIVKLVNNFVLTSPTRKKSTHFIIPSHVFQEIFSRFETVLDAIYAIKMKNLNNIS